MAGPSQSSSKAELVAIKTAVQQKNFDEAAQRAQALVQTDPKNYQALIFLGYSLDRTKRLDEAEVAYRDAAGIRPADAQGWQGLVQVYQRQGAKKLADYQTAVLKLAQVYHAANDLYKCQDVVDKYVDFAKAVNASRLQIVDAYGVCLPSSPIYPLLEGRLPHPAHTFERIARLLEEDEKEKVNTMIGSRRGMIGTKLADITVDVKREVYLASKLPDIYRQIINWTNDDDARRGYEEKLLQYVLDQLLVSPAKEKARYFQVVRKLADDMVVIKHPFKLAWDISIDWLDYREIAEWDIDTLQGYCACFPHSDLYKVLAGFLTSSLSPFPGAGEKLLAAAQPPSRSPDFDGDESEDDEDGGVPISVIPFTDEDRLIMITDGVSSADSLLAYRLAGAYYQHIEDHESNVELMNKALAQVAERRSETGQTFSNSENAFNVQLATALVFHQSPRHHQDAKALFDRVLQNDTKSTPALIGVGLIYEEEEKFDDAIEFLERALARDAENLRVRTEAAWVHSLNGNHEKAKEELEACIPLLVEKGPSEYKLLAQTQYRLGACLWKMDTSKAWRKDRTKAYAQFIGALKSDLNCAPAYTSLGIYYSDYAKDKKRARRCFQKAVELSSSEVESAERLVQSFADEGDWDRVELVAQRVVDSGKVKPPPGSKRKGISWPFAALGVAQLNKQDYVQATVSFQAATRISWNDYHSFVGLGESYHRSGKHFSAIKALLEAQRLEAAAGLEAADTWFTKFLLANIYRELGSFDEAIALYQAVTDVRSEEAGVGIALMQTMVDNAFASVESGYFGKAVQLATDALKFASQAPSSITETFNYWKAVADACSVFSSVQGKVMELPVDVLQSLFAGKASDVGFDLLHEVDGVHSGVVLAQGLFPDDEKVGVDLTRCLHATILAHKRAVFVAAQDTHAQAVSFYNLGWAEHRAHNCLPASLRIKPSSYLKVAVRCFKRAIELEAGNADFWNALGVVTSSINPAVSQHAFVRSLYLNERNAHVWANLGTLGLLHSDFDFASQAFTNAQSNDPDYAHGWLGQGFVALQRGRVKEARGHFTQAMELSAASLRLARQQYSLSVFDHMLSMPTGLACVDIVQPLFALSQLRRLKPQELPYGHLYTLFQERINKSAHSVGLLEEACSALESDYEVSESPQSLKQFALATADLARAYLAAGSFQKAASSGMAALQLSSEESDGELESNERTRVRLAAHLTVGLANYHSGDFVPAVGYFESALEESNRNPDAVCLLAQMLWAEGTGASRERARDLLFDVIATQPDHVQSVLLLGVIALLDGDQESLEAVLAELHGLQASDKVSPAEQDEIGRMLQAIVSLPVGAEVASTDDMVTQAQTDIMLHPHLPHGWSNLANLTDTMGVYPADMALRVALKAVPPRGSLRPEGLAKVYAGSRKAADAQAAVMVAPWLGDGWETLNDAVPLLQPA